MTAYVIAIIKLSRVGGLNKYQRRTNRHVKSMLYYEYTLKSDILSTLQPKKKDK